MSDLLTPMTIRVAATLRLADHVADGRATVPELAAACGADPGMLDPLVGHLTEVGFLRIIGERVELTALGALLRDDAPGRCRRALALDGGVGRSEIAITRLLESVRTGRPAYELEFGRAFWEDVEDEPELAESLNVLKPTTAGFGADLVIDGFDWSRADSVVDVGGSNGALLAELLSSHPNLRGTVLDLPRFADAAAGVIAAADLSDRAAIVGRSFFDPLPPGADVYLLSGILFDWADADAVRILRRCRDAAGPSGTVLIAEISLDNWGAAPSPTTVLRTKITVPGHQRGPDELVRIAAAAGLSPMAEARVAGPRSLIPFTPEH